MGSHEQVILLDTHVLVWLTTEPTRLSKHASSAIKRASRGGGIAISAIMLCELAWLVSYGRLQVAGTVEAYLDEVSSRASVRPITAKVAAWANQYPADYSGDP
jgi:PIN domain nuclease of toxin-antitoxin system